MAVIGLSFLPRFWRLAARYTPPGGYLDPMIFKRNGLGSDPFQWMLGLNAAARRVGPGWHDVSIIADVPKLSGHLFWGISLDL
jgi:hypothetical protein